MSRKINLDTNISKRLREFRKEPKISVKEVEEILKEMHIKCSYKTIYKLESNEITPNIIIIKALCEIYERDIEGLFSDENVEREILSMREAVLIKLYRNSSVIKNFINVAIVNPAINGTLDLKNI